MSAPIHRENRHSGNRAFNYAVLASIVLHAALLFGISVRERVRPVEPAGPLVARLIEAPATAPAPAAAAAPRSEPVKPQAAARPRPKPAAPKPVAKAQPAPRVEPATEPAAEAPQSNEKEPATPVPEPAAPPVTAGVDSAPSARSSASPGEAGATQAGADARSVAEYRLQLIGAAPRYKRYPRVARENNWEGLVALRMAFSASGRVASLSVTKTSGYDVLDQQAMEMFKSAAAAVPVPPLLRGREFAFDLAVTYYFTE
jgi:protein TonB